MLAMAPVSRKIADMKSRRAKIILAVLLALLLVIETIASVNGAGLTSWLYAARPYHFREVQHGVLYRDGLRNPVQFMCSVNKAQPKTLVSLLSKAEIETDRFAPAIAEARAAGVQTECLDISEGDWPSNETIQRFLSIATDPQRQPVMVHCREGVRRTGMMVAAYQMSVLGYSKEQAKAAIEHFDHTGRTLRDLERFVDLYDPASRSVIYGADGAADRLD